MSIQTHARTALSEVNHLISQNVITRSELLLNALEGLANSASNTQAQNDEYLARLKSWDETYAITPRECQRYSQLFWWAIKQILEEGKSSKP